MAVNRYFPGKVFRARRVAAVLLVSTGLVTSVSPASADEYVSGYYRSNGSYVGGYYRTSADGWSGNNNSYYGNYNPYTGRYGTNRDLASSWSSLSYGSSTHRSYSSNAYGGSYRWPSGRR